MAELATDAALRKRLGAAARQRIQQHFTLTAHVEALCRAYHR
jgi:glycosyltransferase involved in cell wall biosynthesis